MEEEMDPTTPSIMFLKYLHSMCSSLSCQVEIQHALYYVDRKIKCNRFLAQKGVPRSSRHAKVISVKTTTKTPKRILTPLLEKASAYYLLRASTNRTLAA